MYDIIYYSAGYCTQLQFVPFNCISLVLAPLNHQGALVCLDMCHTRTLTYVYCL